MADNKPASLKDVLPYDPETYLSKDEVDLIRNTFQGNEKLIKVLRKIFLPSAFDPELPIEEIGGDVWMANFDFTQMQSSEIKPLVLGRQDAIKFVIGGLIKLKVIANQTQETEMEAAYRRQKDSTK
jgi:hypothetical protein